MEAQAVTTAPPPLPRPIRLLLLGFVGVGDIVAVGGVGLAVSRLGFGAIARSAVGIIVGQRLHTEHDTSDGTTSQSLCPEVVFTSADGREVHFIDGGCSETAAHATGDNVTVLYDPSAPAKAEIKSHRKWILTGVCFVMALLFAGVGAVPLAVAARNRRRWSWLLEHGRRVTARIVSVERNGAVNIQGRTPFQIVVHWQDAQDKLHVMRSANL
ncbi:MAG TPA: DUF3592 domain-containing protein [Polyangia bacterium]|nr:DUF3592 domain-containing protein [Polyangia bacterium]